MVCFLFLFGRRKYACLAGGETSDSQSVEVNLLAEGQAGTQALIGSQSKQGASQQTLGKNPQLQTRRFEVCKINTLKKKNHLRCF